METAFKFLTEELIAMALGWRSIEGEQNREPVDQQRNRLKKLSEAKDFAYM